MRLAFFLRIVARGMWDCAKFCAFSALCFLALIGTVAVTDAYRPPNLPTVRSLAGTAGQCARRVPETEELAGMSAGQLWEEMQPALGILDKVCPEISSWTRERYRSGHVFFERGYKGRYAAWWILPQTLEIDLVALTESDAELACTLAHEFRHSRQPYLITVQSQLAKLAGLDRTSELVEADAYAFERIVRRAIQGRGP